MEELKMRSLHRESADGDHLPAAEAPTCRDCTLPREIVSTIW